MSNLVERLREAADPYIISPIAAKLMSKAAQRIEELESRQISPEWVERLNNSLGLTRILISISHGADKQAYEGYEWLLQDLLAHTEGEQ